MEMWGRNLALIAMVDDMRLRKVHNALILFLLPSAVLLSFYFRTFDETMLGVATMIGALVLTIPLFLGRVLGGGDVKLFTVFAFCVDSTSMFWTLVYSFVWGALFGLIRAALQNNMTSSVCTCSGRQGPPDSQSRNSQNTFTLSRFCLAGSRNSRSYTPRFSDEAGAWEPIRPNSSSRRF